VDYDMTYDDTFEMAAMAWLQQRAARRVDWCWVV